MKNLDLNAYGVEEMNQQEISNVDGGSWIEAAVFTALTVNLQFGILVVGAVVGAAIASQELH